MVRLMCAPPDENLRPNISNAGDSAGKFGEVMLLAGNLLFPDMNITVSMLSIVFLVYARFLVWVCHSNATLASPESPRPPAIVTDHQFNHVGKDRCSRSTIVHTVSIQAEFDTKKVSVIFLAAAIALPLVKFVLRECNNVL